MGSVCLQCFLSLGGGGVERLSLRKQLCSELLRDGSAKTDKENTSVAIQVVILQYLLNTVCSLLFGPFPTANMVLLRNM